MKQLALAILLFLFPQPARAASYRLDFSFVQQSGETWTVDEINTAYWETVRAAQTIGGIEIAPPGVVAVDRYEWRGVGDAENTIYELPRGEMTVYVFKDEANRVYLNGWAYPGNSAVLRYAPYISGIAYHELRHLVYLLPPE